MPWLILFLLPCFWLTGPPPAGEAARPGGGSEAASAGSAHTAPAPRPPTRRAGLWRRTDRGWEHIGGWPLPAAPRLSAVTHIHPLVIAALELLISLAALLAWPPRRP